MENPEERQPKFWFKIPEDLALMSDQEMKMFAQSLWLEINNKMGEDYEER